MGSLKVSVLTKALAFRELISTRTHRHQIDHGDDGEHHRQQRLTALSAAQSFGFASLLHLLAAAGLKLDDADGRHHDEEDHGLGLTHAAVAAAVGAEGVVRCSGPAFPLF